MSSTSESYIHDVQRKNGKIIIRAICELEGKVTFEAIVGKICEDLNIFRGRSEVERSVRGFLSRGYYLGLIDINADNSFKVNDRIAEKSAEQYLASRESECRPSTPKRKCPKK